MLVTCWLLAFNILKSWHAQIQNFRDFRGGTSKNTLYIFQCHKTTCQIYIGTLRHRYYENHKNQMYIKCQVRAIISKYLLIAFH